MLGGGDQVPGVDIPRAGADLCHFRSNVNLADPHMVRIRVAHHLGNASDDDIIDFCAKVDNLLHLGAGHGKCCVIFTRRDAIYACIIRQPGKRQFHDSISSCSSN